MGKIIYVYKKALFQDQLGEVFESDLFLVLFYRGKTPGSRMQRGKTPLHYDKKHMFGVNHR